MGDANAECSGKPVHVGFLLQDTGFVYGAERATLDLARGLCRRHGMRVSFLLIEERRRKDLPDHLRAELEGVGCSFFSCPARHRFSHELIRRIRWICQMHAVDILDCVGAKATCHGFFAARGSSSTILSSTIHGWTGDCRPKARLYELLERRTLRRFDGLVVLSRFYEERLRANGFNMSRVRLVRPGPLAPDPPPWGLAERPGTRTCVTGMLARFSPEKNHDLLLEVAGLLAERGSGIGFLLAGDGLSRNRIQEQVEQRGLQDRIELPGYMSRPEFFSSVDVVVLCSRLENQPNALLEAMARGIPVVATDVGGVGEMIRDRETGLLVPPGSPEALASALDCLCKNPGERERLGGNAREHFSETYGHERCAEEYSGFYRELLAGSPHDP